METTTSKSQNGQHEIDYLAKVSQEINELLEEHIKSGFEKGFNEYPNAPFNPATNRHYEGGNSIILNRHASKNGHKVNSYLTFYNVSGEGASVLIGKRSQKILSKMEYKYFNENGQEVTEDVAKLKKQKKEIPYEVFVESTPKTYPVFNVQDTKNLPGDYYEGKNKDWADDKDVLVQINDLTTDLGIQMSQSKSKEKSHYDKSTDKIVLEPKANFKSDKDYIDAILPLIAEATGHKERLDRPSTASKDSKDYLKEKFANEMTASALGNQLGYYKSITDDKELLEGFKRQLKNPYFFLQSANQFKRSMKFIKDNMIERELAPAQEVENTETKTPKQKMKELEKAQNKQAKGLSQSLAKA